MDKLVSVIIPTFGGAEKIDRAIKSVLMQTYKNIEIIVVDDNNFDSMDRVHTESVLKKYKNNNIIKYIKHEVNKNGAVARNTGIRYVKGEYLCFLDDDDFYFPERIKKSVEFLDSNSRYQGVYCNVVLTQNSELIRVIEAKKELNKKDILLNEMVIGTGSNIFIKSDIVRSIRGFDEKFIRHQDLEFMLRILDIANIGNLNEILIVKAQNKTNNRPHYLKFIEMKQMYINKFKYEIDQLSETEKRTFYESQYRALLYAAFASKNNKNIQEAVLNLEKIRSLTVKEKIWRSMAKIGFYQSKPYKFIGIYIEKILKAIKPNKIDKLSNNELIYVRTNIES